MEKKVLAIRSVFFVGTIVFILLIMVSQFLFVACQLNSASDDDTAPTSTATYSGSATPTPTPDPFVTPTETSEQYVLGPEVPLSYDGDVLTMDSGPDGSLHLVYIREDIVRYLFRQNDSWSAEITVPDSSDANSRFYPGVACSPDGAVHVIWTNQTANTIYHRYYQNGTWSAKTKAIEGIWPTNRPDIDASDDGTLYVVAQKDYGIAYSVYDGASWLWGNYIFYSTPREPQFPRVAAGSNSTAHCVFSSFWGVASATGEIGFSSYDRNANTWSEAVAPFLVPNSPGLPEIYNDREGRTHIFWMEWTEEASYSKIGYSVREQGNWSPVTYVIESPFIGFLDSEPHMYFIEGADNEFCLVVPKFGSAISNTYFFILKNTTWTGPFLMANPNSVYQQERYPALTYSQGKYHFCWRDWRGGIYYRWMEIH